MSFLFFITNIGKSISDISLLHAPVSPNFVQYCTTGMQSVIYLNNPALAFILANQNKSTHSVTAFCIILLLKFSLYKFIQMCINWLATLVKMCENTLTKILFRFCSTVISHWQIWKKDKSLIWSHLFTYIKKNNVTNWLIIIPAANTLNNHRPSLNTFIFHKIEVYRDGAEQYF